MSESFLASVPPQLKTLFHGRQAWPRNARYRAGGLR
jgi:hypothetical protein